ncbi:hypothetical protein BGZ98_001482 [Dissophora globulifera]|nr:hypothetical protein BGZ98_001482 [Dissophora globulifera]
MTAHRHSLIARASVGAMANGVVEPAPQGGLVDAIANGAVNQPPNAHEHAAEPAPLEDLDSRFLSSEITNVTDAAPITVAVAAAPGAL